MEGEQAPEPKESEARIPDDSKPAEASASMAAEEKPLSKNQMKKRARLEGRAEKLRKDKEDKKLQKAAKKAKVQAEFAALPPDELESRQLKARERANARRLERVAAAARVKQGQECGVKVAVDLDFPGLMAEKELKSLVQQLAYCISSNQRGTVPCSLHFTSFQGDIRERTARQFPGHTNWVAGLHEGPFHEVFAAEKSRIVYLTADSENILSDIEPDGVYVIGGLVDRNRHKRICLERAEKLGVQTARLPIKDHVALAGSKVLTVNHVVGILVKYLEVRDWKAACEFVIPVRKQATTDQNATQLEPEATKADAETVCEPSATKQAE